ncbi:MAG: AAA family ATPase [Planctomycetaceae bacterium]|nr:AAA family ATPase [Planctomycetaceae bacterium]
MITGIAIENFKGIRDRIELELKPITLLFGPNSAGKSTVLQALHYAAEIFDRLNTDADQTVSGGEFVNLGGFRNLAHAHNLEETVRLRVELSEVNFEVDWGEGLLEEHFGLPENLAVEIGVRWDDVRSLAYVETYELYLNGMFFAEVKFDPNESKPWISRLNVGVDYTCLLAIGEFKSDEECEEMVARGMDVYESALSFYRRNTIEFFQTIAEPGPESDTQVSFRLLLQDQPSALPRPGGQFKLAYKHGYAPSGFGFLSDMDFDFFGYDSEPDDQKRRQFRRREMGHEFAHFISRVLTIPIDLVREQLRAFRYLGPIRILPPRNFVPQKSSRHSKGLDREHWSSGLGAWHALYRQHNSLIPQVNRWLADKERLDSGYRIRRKDFKELELSDPAVATLLSGQKLNDDMRLDLESLATKSRLVVIPTATDIELQPADIGIGISQVVPVVVTAMDGANKLSAIEQPELHLHPRIQAELGDLFIEGAKSSGGQFLIETHSEHLILRLLRRIRETEKGTADAEQQLRTDDLAVNYVRQKDGCCQVTQIDVDVKGEFIQPWPDDFFEIDFYERFG